MTFDGVANKLLKFIFRLLLVVPLIIVAMHSYIALCDHFLKGREGAGLIGIIGLIPWIFLCRWVFLPVIKFFLWNGGFIVSIKRLFVLGLFGAIFEVGSLILSDAKNGYIMPVIAILVVSILVGLWWLAGYLGIKIENSFKRKLQPQSCGNNTTKGKVRPVDSKQMPDAWKN
ncbi:MAG: hypothetical protein B9S32_09705 [Verrucomicrobia bacterium Tous-C9LFEB]|nr:MAG: hypothetical protein B9S32_09705 [Verrucomicrobia bacterium Tous-C9LFEB]